MRKKASRRFVNRYPGTCVCGLRVDVGEGMVHLEGERWKPLYRLLIITVERVARAEAVEHKPHLFVWDARNRRRPALPEPLGDHGPARPVRV